MELERIEQCLECQPEQNVRAAVAILLVPEDTGIEILLEVRSRNVSQPDEICLPGGHLEAGETPWQAACREVWEKLGISGKALKLLGYLPAERSDDHGAVQPVVAICDKAYAHDLRSSRNEVAETFRVPLDWLQKHPQDQYVYLEKSDASMPACIKKTLSRYSPPYTARFWDYNGYGIWGLTSRILRKFIDRIEKKEATCLLVFRNGAITIQPL